MMHPRSYLLIQNEKKRMSSSRLMYLFHRLFLCRINAWPLPTYTNTKNIHQYNKHQSIKTNMDQYDKSHCRMTVSFPHHNVFISFITRHCSNVHCSSSQNAGGLWTNWRQVNERNGSDDVVRDQSYCQRSSADRRIRCLEKNQDSGTWTHVTTGDRWPSGRLSVTVTELIREKSLQTGAVHDLHDIVHGVHGSGQF